jgi:hypothetical protein
MKRIYYALALVASFGAAFCTAPAARAAESTATLRAELDALKTEYQSRIQALEQRLQAAERQLAQQATQPAQPSAQASTQLSVPPPLPAQQSHAAATQSLPDLPVAGPSLAQGARAATPGSEFNPAIGVVLNGTATTYEKDPQDFAIPGAPLGGEAGLTDEGLSIGESEFIFTASVDDWFASRVTLALEQEDGEFDSSLEEAFIDTLSMPANTALRFGRFYSGVGYLNDKHSHSWDFVDQALPYVAFFGSQYTDDGIRLSWLAPTDLYLELGAEAFRGSNYPAAGDAHNGFGTQTVFAHLGGDVGISNSWTAGLSYFTADARERTSGDEDDPLAFDGSTDLYLADFVWKWAPNGNNRDRNLIFQTEYLWRDEDGSYQLPDVADPEPLDTGSAGWYAQLIYQWQPLWRAGVRIDGLDLDDPGTQFAGTPLDTLGDDPLRYTFMLDYSHSEFSRIRLQLERDEAGAENNNQITLQYIMSIGAHGAHEF